MKNALIVVLLLISVNCYTQQTPSYRINWENDSSIIKGASNSLVQDFFEVVKKEIQVNITPSNYADSSQGQIVLPASFEDIKSGGIKPIISLVYCDNKQYLLFRKYDNSCYLYDVKNGLLVTIFYNVWEIAFADNDKLVMRSADKWELFSIREKKVVYTASYTQNISENGYIPNNISVLSDNFFLVREESNEYNKGYLFSLKENRIVTSFENPGNINAGKISYDHQYFSYSGSDKSRSTIIYDLINNKEVIRLKHSFFNSWANHSNKLLYENIDKRKIYEYDLSFAKSTALAIEPGNHGSVLYSPNDSFIIVNPTEYAFGEGFIKIYHAQTAKLVKELKGSLAITNSNNKDFFIINEFYMGDEFPLLYRFDNFTEVLRMAKKDRLAFSDNGKYLIMKEYSYNDNKYSIIDLLNNKRILNFEQKKTVDAFDEQNNIIISNHRDVLEFYNLTKKTTHFFLYANEEGWLLFDKHNRYDCSKSFEDRIFFTCGSSHGSSFGYPISHINKEMHVRNLCAIINSGRTNEIKAPIMTACGIQQIYDRTWLSGNLGNYNYVKPTINSFVAPTVNFLIDGENNIIDLNNYSGKPIQILESQILYACEIWNKANSRLLFTYYVDHLGGYMALTPDGYFTKSNKFYGKVAFSINDVIVEFDQLYNIYYRPDIINGMLSTNEAKNRTEYNINKGIKNPPKIVLDFLNSKNRGMVVLNQNEGEKRSICVKAIDMGGGIRGIRVYNNGKLIEEKMLKQTIYSDSLSITVAFNAINGKNVIEAIGISDDQTESKPSMVSFDYTTSLNNAVRPNLYIFSIGINEYENTKYNLNYCVADMESFTDSLKQISQNLFGSVWIKKLKNNEATKDNIKMVFDELSNLTQPNDVFVFYFAGHGIALENEANKEFYFIFHGVRQMTDNNSCNLYGVSGSEMKEYLKAINANKQLSFIDACNSGALAEQFTVRGAAEENAIAKLSRSTGSAIFSSTTNNQSASELAQINHGVFTYVLLNAFKGEAADKNCQIFLTDLKKYIDVQVPVITEKYKGSKQYPITFMFGQDFPIGIKCNPN